MIAPRFKIALGLALGLILGGVCRWLGLTSPAPTAISGALLVAAMTSGYVIAGRWLVQRACRTTPLCGGPDGSVKNPSVSAPARVLSHRTPSHQKSRRHR
jgi:XapX domain-containing protein